MASLLKLSQPATIAGWTGRYLLQDFLKNPSQEVSHGIRKTF